VSGLVTFGETMALLTSPRGRRLRHAASLALSAAGAESNLAIGFERLGGAATWIGRVGDDELGQLVTSAIRGTGVTTRAVVDDERPTGLMIKERRSSVLNRVTYYRDTSAGSRLRASDLDGRLPEDARVVHVTGITTALSPSARGAVFAALDEYAPRGAVASVDLNYREALWSPDEARPVLSDLVRRADVLFCTDDEARLVVDGSDPIALARALARLGPREVVVKLGAEGSVTCADGVVHRTPAMQVTAIDSVGAGDAFAAGYLFELTRGRDVVRRLATGTRTGAFAVTVDGDWEGAPAYAELDHLELPQDQVIR
jgi:2-dehydro-3-deoxygluconokinase